MDPQLQQLLMALGQQRLQTGTVPNNPPAYPPVGQSLQPMVPAPAMGAGATTTALDEQGNPLPTYGRGEPAFGNANVGGGGTMPSNATPTAGQAPGGFLPGGGNKLLEALKGVAAPRPPDVVKPSTPHLPPLRPIEGGGLIQLMASLGISPKDVPGLKQSIGR